MSSFNCETCHALCCDTECGYVTGCEHYPVNQKHLRQWYRVSLRRLYDCVKFMAEVSAHNKDGLTEPFLRWQSSILGAMDMVSTSADTQPATAHVPVPEQSTPPACGRSETCSRCGTGCRE